MKTLYLHIGTPKTGTTSLQSMMAKNRALLEKHGFSYPDLGFHYPEIMDNRNGHFLVAPVIRPNGSLDRSRPSDDYEAGLNMLPPLAKKFDAIILSDEGIYHTSRFRPDFWTKLKEDLEKRDLSLKIIIYLRRQDLFLESLYAQRVRQQHCSLRFNDFVKTRMTETPSYTVDYFSYLENIASVIGRENIIVHVFEKSQFGGRGSDLYSDFLRIFGLTPDEFVIEKEINNVSLGGEYLEIKRILNKLPVDRPEQHLVVRNMMTLTDIPHPGYDPKQKYSFFEAKDREEFLRHYEESNREVARTYLHREDGVLFREPVKSHQVYNTSDHDLLYCTILAYGDTLEKMSDDIKSIRQQTNSLKNNNLIHCIKAFYKKALKKLHIK